MLSTIAPPAARRAEANVAVALPCEQRPRAPPVAPRLLFNDLRANYDEEALLSFYDRVMVPAFPIDEELDDVESWLADFRPTSERRHDASRPRTHLILAVCADPSVARDPSMAYDSAGRAIAGGTLFDYFPGCHCGLISYFVVHPAFRRMGILRRLVDAAVKSMNDDAVAARGRPCEAIFAETNRLEVHDTVMDPAERHKVFHSLGFQLVQFRYTQPPVAQHKNASDDLLLVVYRPVGESLDARIIASFITENADYVFGPGSMDRLHGNTPWYAKQTRQLRALERVAIRAELPWTTPAAVADPACAALPESPMVPAPARGDGQPTSAAIAAMAVAASATATQVMAVLGAVMAEFTAARTASSRVTGLLTAMHAGRGAIDAPPEPPPSSGSSGSPDPWRTAAVISKRCIGNRAPRKPPHKAAALLS